MRRRGRIFLFLTLLSLICLAQEEETIVLKLEGSRAVSKVLKEISSAFQEKNPGFHIIIKERRLKEAFSLLKKGEIDGVLLTLRSYHRYRLSQTQFHPFLLRGYKRKDRYYYPYIYGIASFGPPSSGLKKLLLYLASPEGHKTIASLGPFYLPYTPCF